LNRKMVAVFLMAVAVLSGCNMGKTSIVQGDISFTFMQEGEFPELDYQTDPTDLQVRMLREDSSSVVFAVSLPYNADIKNIALLKDNSALIELMPKPETERSDPFLSLSPAYYRVVSVNKKYKGSFQADSVKFGLGTEILNQPIGYASALSYAQDHMETDFLSTMDCLALIEVEGGLKLAYIFFFGDGENINRAGNELIQGAVAVDSQNGQLIEYRIYNRQYLPGVHRHAEALRIEGWRDSNTLIGSELEGGEYYLTGMDRSKTKVSKEQAEKYIEEYERTTTPPAYLRFVQVTDINDIGFEYTKDAYLEYTTSKERIAINLPQNVNVVNENWDKTNNVLYIATEMAEPSYGNDWTYYTLWRFGIKDKTLSKIGGIPSRDFYLSPDGAKAAYNGPEGDLFIINIGKLLTEDPILK